MRTRTRIHAIEKDQFDMTDKVVLNLRLKSKRVISDQ